MGRKPLEAPLILFNRAKIGGVDAKKWARGMFEIIIDGRLPQEIFLKFNHKEIYHPEKTDDGGIIKII